MICTCAHISSVISWTRTAPVSYTHLVPLRRCYQCFSDYGLLSLTGIDIPGEAGTIMHKLDNIGEVELATMTFGQSFQITPVQLAVMASSVVNGGRRITPHFGVAVQDQDVYKRQVLYSTTSPNTTRSNTRIRST